MDITWQITVVGKVDRATKPSLAFSPSGQAGIAYHSSLQQALKFATPSGQGLDKRDRRYVTR
jgi:hypothetical protein